MTQVVIATVPFVDEDTPLAAPAVLKSVLESHGIHCVGLDLNIYIYNKILQHPNRHLFLDFFYNQNIHESIVSDLIDMFEFYVYEITKHNPDIVGLSLFSHNSQVATTWISAMIKESNPNIKIVIGGPGLETLENAFFKFPDRLKQLGLINDYIVGDAEESLVEYVKNNKDYPGINSHHWKKIKNFSDVPTPNYDDYTFLLYRTPLLHVIDSRGCVQDCEFCDVIAFWDKFQYKTAQNIFNQMIEYTHKYKQYRFQFGSSLSNGNLREFKKLMKLMSDYNKTVSLTEQLHWNGSFIIRSKKSHDEELWKLIKESNAFLFCGVESLTERVRNGLGKKFKDDDLMHHLKMAQKYQVPMNLLLIATYPGETDEEFEKVKQWFVDNKHYANNTVMQVQLTLPSILPGTKLESRIDLNSFVNEKEIRLHRGNELKDIVESCGFITRAFY